MVESAYGGGVLAKSDNEGMDFNDEKWLFAPVLFSLVLFVALIVGVVKALRQSGRRDVYGLPLPNCQWLTMNGFVRVGAFIALLAGLVGNLTALRRFLLGWHDHAPVYLKCLTLFAYVLLGLAVALAGLGLRWKQTMPKVHEALRQAAKASLLAGLASGLATEVLCNTVEVEENMPTNWRVGSAMLGASSGLLLLGLLTAQVDGQARMEPHLEHRDQIAVIDEEHGVVQDRGSQPVRHLPGLDSFASERSPSAQEAADAPRSSSEWPTGAWQTPLQPRLLPPQMPRSEGSGLQEPLLVHSPNMSGWRQSRPQLEVPRFTHVNPGPLDLDRCRGPMGDGLAAPPLMVW